MDNIAGIIQGLVNAKRSDDVKEIETTKLPTQGYFYPKNFNIKIKRASADDILLYNFNYIKNDIAVILSETKRIVKNNIILPTKYKYEDIKSNDLLFIFFEIVKFTMEKEILIPYEDAIGRTSYVAFGSENFNYYDYSIMRCEYNEKTREFEKYGYRFSLPSVGCENSLVNYLYSVINSKDDKERNYDFLFFLGNKRKLTKKEIINLVTIFSEDLDESEIDKINKIIKLIYPSIGYTLKAGNKIVNVEKVDFEKLFLD